jgi:hypothetical protein
MDLCFKNLICVHLVLLSLHLCLGGSNVGVRLGKGSSSLSFEDVVFNLLLFSNLFGFFSCDLSLPCTFFLSSNLLLGSFNGSEFSQSFGFCFLSFH